MPTPADRATLETDLREALAEASARRSKTVVSVTLPYGCADPIATVFASRRAGEPFFCWEQPDRNLRLAALGRVHEITSRGPDRFVEVAADCAHLSGDAVLRGEGGFTTGALWTGGFAFHDEGTEAGVDPAWSSFEPATMILPELAIQSSDAGNFITVNLMAGPGADPAALADSALVRIAGLVHPELPMIDPHPTVAASIESVRSPEDYEQSVAAAVERIRAGEIEKVVLAREVVVRSGSAHDPAAIFGALRIGFPSCFNFCVGTGEATFIGASPELLVRCAGRGVSTVGLAGSTRRSSDPAVDDHLAQQLLGSSKDRGEQAVVVRRIVKSLSKLSVWVEAADEPEIIKVANIQHLGTPVYAQLAQPRTAIELAGLLHPTPAVGGEPWKKARRVMAEVERMDRGWYAGPVGWMDGSGDGEFCVALRSALIRDREAHLFAGVGVVADSDPAAELAETEIKLGALLPLLS
ncbi:MAG TPA: isochorismate synthase [Solirubrobacterales bacterium]|jgi:salicylate biosynthesis isochorismate synthase/menaquinone-specific isochorismate synthase|nr:isochorismate synthase [Solirubrobacterales bacterium]HMU26638.1 isochorismate synthase [Solirubrobacterales bacterium]HMX71554.1 isochorismate synthase [Solirubrobacterales bacterium]HMY25717.1 isochorismate synthase [Solirubrobacterales bacterium]HNA23411.1 isochorismate synthase [Solirubrobacterales bacterium]